jgi:GxxExxY protein
MNARSEDFWPELTRSIIGSAITVHKRLGPGVLESVYRACLLKQLEADGLAARNEVPIPLRYGGVTMPCSFRADIIVEERVLLELKSVEALTDVHQAQILSYLQQTGLRVGLLMNFNVTRLVNGIRRFVR